jgi:hypothetical protein
MIQGFVPWDSNIPKSMVHQVHLPTPLHLQKKKKKILLAIHSRIDVSMSFPVWLCKQYIKCEQTGSFMGCLAQESSYLSFTCGGVPSGSKAGKGLCSGYESIIGVEALGWAATIVTMLEQIIKCRPWDETANVTTTAATASALALAAIGAVISGCAAPAILAAALPTWAESTSSLPSTLLSWASLEWGQQ